MWARGKRKLAKSTASMVRAFLWTLVLPQRRGERAKRANRAFLDTFLRFGLDVSTSKFVQPNQSASTEAV